MSEKQVKATMIFETLVPVEKYQYEAIDFGTFEFEINDETIRFDFNAYCHYRTPLEDGRLQVEYITGYGCVFNDFDICDDFEEDYAEIGLTKQDITAKFLASVSRIEDIFIGFLIPNSSDYEDIPICIKSIVFTDENNIQHSVPKKVIDAYNGV